MEFLNIDCMDKDKGMPCYCVKDLTLVRILRKFRWRVSVILLMPTLCFLNEIEVFVVDRKQHERNSLT